MLTTNTVKVKERSQEDIKLGMLTSNKTKPKEFILKGKGKPPSKDIITTSNVKKYAEKRKKEVIYEKQSAKIRQKKLNAEIKMNKEKEKKAEKALKGLIVAERSY